MNTLTTSNLEKKDLFNLRVHCLLWREIRAGTQCRNLEAGGEAKLQRTAVPGLLTHPAFLYKDLTRGELGSPIAISNQENVLQTCLQASVMETFPYWDSFFPDMCKLVSSWQNPAHLTNFVLDGLMSYWLCYSKANCETPNTIKYASFWVMT